MPPIILKTVYIVKQLVTIKFDFMLFFFQYSFTFFPLKYLFSFSHRTSARGPVPESGWTTGVRSRGRIVRSDCLLPARHCQTKNANSCSGCYLFVVLALRIKFSYPFQLTFYILVNISYISNTLTHISLSNEACQSIFYRWEFRKTSTPRSLAR